MNTLIALTLGGACVVLVDYARMATASALWRSRATIAEARMVSAEAERDNALATAAAVRDVYLAGIARCGACDGCNPEPQGFDLTDHELGDTP